MTNTLGNNIRLIRRSKGLKLKDLSEITELPIPYLADIERDIVNPSLKTLHLIAKALPSSRRHLILRFIKIPKCRKP